MNIQNEPDPHRCAAPVYQEQRRRLYERSGSRFRTGFSRSHDCRFATPESQEVVMTRIFLLSILSLMFLALSVSTVAYGQGTSGARTRLAIVGLDHDHVW